MDYDIFKFFDPKNLNKKKAISLANNHILKKKQIQFEINFLKNLFLQALNSGISLTSSFCKNYSSYPVNSFSFFPSQ